jgi:hypothetical protein
MTSMLHVTAVVMIEGFSFSIQQAQQFSAYASRHVCPCALPMLATQFVLSFPTGFHEDTRVEKQAHRAMNEVTLIRDTPNGAVVEPPSPWPGRGGAEPSRSRLERNANTTRRTLSGGSTEADLSSPAVIHRERVVPAFATDWALDSHHHHRHRTADSAPHNQGHSADPRRQDMDMPCKFGVDALNELSKSVNAGTSHHMLSSVAPPSKIPPSWPVQLPCACLARTLRTQKLCLRGCVVAARDHNKSSMVRDSSATCMRQPTALTV